MTETPIPNATLPCDAVPCDAVPCDAVPCDIVAFMAHPDDAELQCGGTLALAVERGWKAGVVDFTRGELGTRGTPEQRDEEAAAAARELGLSCRVNLRLPDGHLHDCDEHRKTVVQLLRTMRPKVVIGPPREDHHADHVAVATILEHAFYLAGIAKYGHSGNREDTGTHENPPWRPHALLNAIGSRAAVPDQVVDVTSVHAARQRAILCYRSQLFEEEATEPATRISHPEFLDWLDGALRHFGFLVGVRYGEAFTSYSPVPIADPVQQFAREPWRQPTNDD